MVDREQVTAMLKYHLQKAQARMKHYADLQRSDRSFNVDDWVYVKLQPYRQVTLRGAAQHKLSQKYFSPFQVEARIGNVAYKLRLPSMVQVHPVFHVSQLKLHKGTPPDAMGNLPRIDNEGVIAAAPSRILKRKLVKRNNKPAVAVLVQWQGGSSDDVTWELINDFLPRYPTFNVLLTDS
ncbi:uncharacterized protein [Rutidosis leptorrhynchoides]|uniref:uncharacterized protein n=1 Tax=Rutidosis leptorrhynchoides TaxID=125765 RepID=UPI003A99993B